MSAAKTKHNTVKLHIKRHKVTRPGVHAKCKTSKNKTSKNYAKPYVAQGR